MMTFPFEESRIELGPLRASDLTESEREEVGPSWSYLDHGPLLYATRSDHRAESGRIVPRGTECYGVRRAGRITLWCLDGAVVSLDGREWVLVIPEAPRLRPEDFPELFLSA